MRLVGARVLTAARPSPTHQAAGSTTAPPPRPRRQRPAPRIARSPPPPRAARPLRWRSPAADKPDATAAKSLLPPAKLAAAADEWTRPCSFDRSQSSTPPPSRAFGEATKSVSQNSFTWAQSLKTLAQAQEKIEGDTATLTLPGQPRRDPLLRLRRYDGGCGGWRPALAGDEISAKRSRLYVA